MDIFQTWDQGWTPLLFTCGILLLVCGIVIRSLSARRTFTWRIAYAALDFGVTLLAITVVLHFVVPFVVAFATRSFSSR